MDAEEKVPLVHYSPEGHNRVDFSKAGRFVPFAVGGSDDPNREVVSRDKILALASMANFPIYMNGPKNICFIPALTKTSGSDEIKSLKKFIFYLKMVFAVFHTRSMKQSEIVEMFPADGHLAIVDNISLIRYF